MTFHVLSGCLYIHVTVIVVKASIHIIHCEDPGIHVHHDESHTICSSEMKDIHCNSATVQTVNHYFRNCEKEKGMKVI